MSTFLPDALKALKTRPLFTLRGTVNPIVAIGATPNQTRQVGVVTGGLFEGERLSGVLLEGGVDWQTVRSDQATTLDVRLLLKTTDGAVIGMAYRGLRHGPPEVMAALKAGSPVDPSDYYFRIMATFETAAPQYDWLNRILAIGAGHRLPEGPVYNLFEVL